MRAAAALALVDTLPNARFAVMSEMEGFGHAGAHRA